MNARERASRDKKERLRIDLAVNEERKRGLENLRSCYLTTGILVSIAWIIAWLIVKYGGRP